MRKFVEECLSFWKEDPNNVRLFENPEDEQRLGVSLARGQLEPLLADMSGVVKDGGRRLRIARKNGKPEKLFGILTDEPLSASEVHLITSWHKATLSPIDQFMRIDKWFEENPNGTAKDLAIRTGYDASMISKIFSLKDTIDAVKDAAAAGRIGISMWNEISKVDAQKQHDMLLAALNGATRDDIVTKGRAARNGFTESKCKRASIPLPGGTVTISAEELDMVIGLDLLEKLIKSWRRDVGKKDIKQFVSDQKKKLEATP